jgi:hypothetical protein
MILNLSIGEEIEKDARSLEGKPADRDGDAITPVESHAGDIVDIEKAKETSKVEESSV